MPALDRVAAVALFISVAVISHRAFTSTTLGNGPSVVLSLGAIFVYGYAACRLAGWVP